MIGASAAGAAGERICASEFAVSCVVRSARADAAVQAVLDRAERRQQRPCVCGSVGIARVEGGILLGDGVDVGDDIALLVAEIGVLCGDDACAE